MRAHMSDGHLYSGDKVRKFQAKKYFLIDQPDTGEQVFLNLYDAENFCQKHGYNPDECILSGDPEIYQRAVNLARVKANVLKEQSDILNDLWEKSKEEIDRLVNVRDQHEKTNKRNFERELDQENVIKAISKSSGIYEAYKNVRDRYWYFEQIVMYAKP